MSTTTFSGPVKAGNIFNTTGTTLSENLSNQGQATMVQVGTIDESSADPSWTGIVIPANSQITRMAVLVTAAFVNQLDVGRSDSVSTDGDYFLNGLVVNAVGVVEAGTKVANGATAGSSWKDTGVLDVHLTYEDSGGSDTGAGVLIVEYIQNNNLVA